MEKINMSTINQSYRYKFEFIYVDNVNNINTTIRNECCKFIGTTHSYGVNIMPTMLVEFMLDKALLDNMIINMNSNHIIVSQYKYDELSTYKFNMLCFRKKFFYIINKGVSSHSPIDYTAKTQDEMLGEAFTRVQIGLMPIDLHNVNMKFFSNTFKNVTSFDIAKYIIKDVPEMLIEPFMYIGNVEQFILIPSKSVNDALKYLNDNYAFYSTPYIFYMDYYESYLLSTSGKETKSEKDQYSSVLISIKDVKDQSANEIGMSLDNVNKTYVVPVNYVNVSVWNNVINNKVQTKLLGINNNGYSESELKDSSKYMDDKIRNIHIENNNENMLQNLTHHHNSSVSVINIDKLGLDCGLFTLNKSIKIKNIDRYVDLNGLYTMSSKKELYTREDDSFILNTSLTLSKIE